MDGDSMKRFIRPILGILLGIFFLVFTVFGYPSKWFVHGTFGSIDTPTLIYLVNGAIFAVVIPLTIFLLGFFKNMGKEIYIKYGIVFLISLIASLLGEFFGHFNGYGYAPSFEMIFYAAIIGNFLRNAVEVFSLILLIKSISSLFEFKFKTLILTLASSIIYGAFMLIYHIGMIPLAMSMYVIEGIGIGALTGYLVVRENALVTPAIFFGLMGITLLPNYFAVNSSIQTPTRIVLLVLYSLMFIFFILAAIYDIKRVEQEELKAQEQKEHIEAIKKELKENDVFTKEGIEEYLNKL